MSSLVAAAASAGHLPVVQWAYAVRPSLADFQLSQPSNSLFVGIQPSQTLYRLCNGAMRGAHLPVLDWCVGLGLDLSNEILISDFLYTATCDRQVPVLEWIAVHARKHGIRYAFEAPAYYRNDPNQSTARHLAMLDWWQAQHAAQGLPPIFQSNWNFPCKLVWQTDDGLLLIDWWRRYCSDIGWPFQWPVLDINSARSLVDYNRLAVCQWWWAYTVEKVGGDSTAATKSLSMSLMCEYGRTAFLDWFWDLCADSSNALEFPRTMRFRSPFFQVRVIQWWEAKVASGLFDTSVFDFTPIEGTTLFDSLLGSIRHYKAELAALDWWWARRTSWPGPAKIGTKDH
ncbi:hypothetical protein BC828DRAFT_383154 [Blastocladiella britannica]|nr:hypothetical protein BC828DRAFT_383154 [Blastocladiella britannica]